MATRGLCQTVLMPEWLSGMTRNHVGFARAGSNPAEHVLWLLLFRQFCKWFTVTKASVQYTFFTIKLSWNGLGGFRGSCLMVSQKVVSCLH